MAKIAKSAVLPTSSVPWLAARPSAAAADRVTPASASSGVRRNSVARHVQHQQQRRGGRAAGIAVAGDRDRHPGPAHCLDRRQLRLAQEIEGAGQQHRHGAGARHGTRRRPRRCIPDDRPRARRTPPPAPRRQVGELVGMELDRQVEGARRREDPRGSRSGVKAIFSQKASTASASPATAGSISSTTRSI